MPYPSSLLPHSKQPGQLTISCFACMKGEDLNASMTAQSFHDSIILKDLLVRVPSMMEALGIEQVDVEGLWARSPTFWKVLNAAWAGADDEAEFQFQQSCRPARKKIAARTAIGIEQMPASGDCSQGLRVLNLLTALSSRPLSFYFGCCSFAIGWSPTSRLFCTATMHLASPVMFPACSSTSPPIAKYNCSGS